MSQRPERTSHSILQRYHERHMEGGQQGYFDTSEGELRVRPEQRLWWAAHRAKAERLLQLNSSDFFVDLGCGEGFLTLQLAGQAGESAGVDLAFSALQVLKQQSDFPAANLKLVVAAGDNISLVDGCADKLLCNHVLEHVLDDDAIMQEIYRIVRPGGRVLIGLPLALGPQIRLLLRLRRWLFPRARRLQLERVEPGVLVAELIGKQSHIRFYSLPAVYDLLERNGFCVLRAEGVGLGWRGRLAGLFRRHRLLFSLSTALGRLWPGIGDGVLVLAERRAG